MIELLEQIVVWLLAGEGVASALCAWSLWVHRNGGPFTRLVVASLIVNALEDVVLAHYLVYGEGHLLHAHTHGGFWSVKLMRSAIMWAWIILIWEPKFWKKKSRSAKAQD